MAVCRLLDDQLSTPGARLARFVFDLTPDLGRCDRVLAYLRDERLAHTVSEEQRWTAVG